MAVPKVIDVKSLSAFTKEIEKLLASTRRLSHAAVSPINWYRGHSLSETYELKPGLYRHPARNSFDELFQLEEEMMAAFERQAILHNYGGVSATPMTKLFYMQHWGVPTRLLDWTTNPYIALYFALSASKANGAGIYPEAAAVWVLDPFRWNHWAMRNISWPQERGPADMNHKDVVSFHPKNSPDRRGDSMYQYPVAIVGAANTQRMLAQRGAFTVFGTDLRPMEVVHTEPSVPAGCLVKLRIPETHIDELLRTLIALGYTDSVAYPDLQGLAMEIKRLNGFAV